jgi:hypothetical protein
MPLFLRFIKSNKTSTWEECQNLSLLPEDDVPADILSELFPIQKNQLSVYQVDDNRSTLDFIIAAFAANRKNLQQICFVLFDPQVLPAIGIGVRQVQGELKDEEVNRLHFHLELSGKKLVGLARELLVNGEVDTRDTEEVAQLIKQSCNAKRFRWDDLEPKLKQGIERELGS